MSEKVFAFDLGKASLGEAVRMGSEIVDSHSFLIPEELGSIKEQAVRRRQQRTRIAHKKREEWLDRHCREAGIPILKSRFESEVGSDGEHFLEKEFPGKGDDTVYTSCLLRIKLLRGEKLEGWQIYKALRSAIQRRGYDPKVPWKRAGKNNKKTDTNASNDDEAENRKRLSEYEETLEQISNGNEDYQYPCYFEAFKMGLWNPETDTFSSAIDHNAGQSRNNVAPRRLVEKEVRQLLVNVSKLYPYFRDKIDLILNGPTGKAYGSFWSENREKYELREGSEKDWDALLGQKIPRFDNRSPYKCRLIPRFNVCRADDVLVMQCTFLMKLMNMRYEDAVKQEHRLTVDDIRELCNQADEEARAIRIELKASGADRKDIAFQTARKYRLLKGKWKTWLRRNKGGTPIIDQEVIDAPKIGGRSSFSRPALRILRSLILSGMSPHEYYDELAQKMDNTNPMDGLVVDDIDFLRLMPDDWERIHIPAVPLTKTVDPSAEAEEAIRQLIGSQKDPIVRHRLMFFNKRLQELKECYGTPDRVVLEFVRDDFLGKEAKSKLAKSQNKNRKEREEALNKAREHGIAEISAPSKIRLLEEQAYKCPYTGECLSISRLDEYQIDHIVPQGSRYQGADAWWNKVVTARKTNALKGEQTPYEFISKSGGWDSYRERIGKLSSLSWKKKRLLVSETPEEYNEKYTALAETAWIARVARSIVCLTFGWRIGEAGEINRVPVVSGGLTARVRRRYKLDSLLHDEVPEDPRELEKKNRKNPLHHALDAMVISYLTGAARTPHLPEGVTARNFLDILHNLYPEPVALKKPALEETIYRKRTVPVEGKAQFKEIAVKREALSVLFPTDKSVKSAMKKTESILDDSIRGQIVSFLETDPTQEAFQAFLGQLRQSQGKGSHVKKVRISIGDITEYADFSKRDDKGQYKKGDKHQGQYVYRSADGTIGVRPVYIFQSRKKVEQELLESGMAILDFFIAGCLVEIENDFVYKGKQDRFIPSGRYLLGSLKSNKQVKINSSLSVFELPIHINDLTKAGFRRVK